jgi:hypothetical protein
MSEETDDPEIVAEIAAERAAAKEGGYTLPRQAERAIACRIIATREATAAKKSKETDTRLTVEASIAAGTAAFGGGGFNRVANPKKSRQRNVSTDPRVISGEIPGCPTRCEDIDTPAAAAVVGTHGHLVSATPSANHTIVSRQKVETNKRFDQIAKANARAAAANEARSRSRCGRIPSDGSDRAVVTPPGPMSVPTTQTVEKNSPWSAAGLKVAWSHFEQGLGLSSKGPRQAGDNHIHNPPPSDAPTTANRTVADGTTPSDVGGEHSKPQAQNALWL